MTGKSGLLQGQIVVGVDRTAASAAAVRWAAGEARLRQAGLHLVFACDHDRHRRAYYAGGPGASRPAEAVAGWAVLFAAERLASQALPPGCLSAELADGPPARVLIDRSAGADLLVLGTAYQAWPSAGEGPPGMGPVARACLQGAACPVVVVAQCPRACTPACTCHPAGADRRIAPFFTCENTDEDSYEDSAREYRRSSRPSAFVIAPAATPR